VQQSQCSYGPTGNTRERHKEARIGRALAKQGNSFAAQGPLPTVFDQHEFTPPRLEGVRRRNVHAI
jgi:hypothetical protein